MMQNLAHHCRSALAAAPRSEMEVQRCGPEELQVGNLEDELAGVRLRYAARAARLAPPHVLAMLQSGAAATWRSALLDDMECMYRLLAPKLDELGSPEICRRGGRIS